MPEALTIKDSQIHGLGVFATKSIPGGTVFVGYPTHRYEENDCLRLNFGGFINHSRTPNATIVPNGCNDTGYLQIIAPVAPGEEITVDYATVRCGKDYVNLIEPIEAKVIPINDGPQRA